MCVCVGGGGGGGGTTSFYSANVCIICSYFKSLIVFQTAENGRNFGHFTKIAYKVEKSKCFSNM